MGNAGLGFRCACICSALCCATNVSAGPCWDTVVFRDDFDYGPGPPNPDEWIVNHPECIWPQCTQWLQGRTRFPNPTPWLATGEFPIVENGILVIRHHLYDPYDSDGANETFLGGEVHTRQEFEPNRPYRFEARVKLDSSAPNGLVTSFFSYGYASPNSDEIDFEFLSNKTNDDTTYPAGDPVLTNPWNESHQCPQFVLPDGLHLTDWHTFRIYWYPPPDAECPNGGRVEWWWLDPVHGETLLRTEEDVSCVPDEPMALYFNFWAPCYTGWGHGCNPWDDAADPSLQPANTPDENQVYRYEIDYLEVRATGQGNFGTEVKLTASDAAADDIFGISVSVSGDTAVVGAYQDDGTCMTDVSCSNSGSAYVYVRSAGVWTQQQKLTASDAAAGDRFGSVSVSGDTALVGAYLDDGVDIDSGSAYVFVRVGGVWTQQQKLTALDEARGVWFGISVSVSGDTAVVGTVGDDDAGAYSGSAYVYVRSGGAWTQQQKLTAADAAAGDGFGHSVSVSGDTAVVGAFGYGGPSNAAGAYVFVRTGGVWTQQQKLTAADAVVGDAFGLEVSVSGDTAVVGARDDDDAGTDSGSAYVFVRSGGVWTQQQKLTASDAAAGDSFGNEVSVSGDTAVVGAYGGDDAGADSGSAYVFVRSGAVWTQQQKLTASDAAAGDSFGNEVSVSGDTVVVAAGADDDAGTDSGSAYVFVVCADSDGDGVCDADDLCPCTLPCVVVDAQGRSFGDLDADCDVDLDDFRELSACFNGPDNPPADGCLVDADLDGDGDVDLHDFCLLQLGFTGPG